MDKPLWGLRIQAPFGAVGIGTGTWAVLASIPVGTCACGAEGPMASIGPLALGAKGCVERLHCFAQGAADWRSGSRWRIISALCPVHPFPLRGTSPQGETRDMKRKTGESYASCTTPAFPPLVAGATTFPPQVGALWMLSHGVMSLQESIERFILSPGWGKVRRSRIRGSRAAANHQNASYAI